MKYLITMSMLLIGGLTVSCSGVGQYFESYKPMVVYSDENVSYLSLHGTFYPDEGNSSSRLDIELWGISDAKMVKILDKIERCE